MQYQLITTFEELETVCSLAQRQGAVALDTEFVRTRTLTPHLGLSQLYDGQHLVLIDPLAIDNMQPFVALLENEAVVKVLHSCSEDLETFLTAFDTVPKPIFDTQFAASILGKGPTLGYAKIVEMLCDVVLDKGESRTDWLARPLRSSQLEYAALDVIYLLPAYLKIQQQLKDEGRFDAALEESARLAALKKRVFNQDEAYKDIKNAWKLNPQQLAVLKVLARWRAQQAASRD